MDLSKIVTIAGRPGLYQVKSQSVGKIIVESLIDGKCSPAFARERMSSLEEISIYSVDEDRPLKEVFRSIHEKMGDKVGTLAGGVREKTEDEKKAGSQQQIAPGAVHSADIEYAMGNLDTNEYYAWQKEDYDISRLFLS